MVSVKSSENEPVRLPGAEGGVVVDVGVELWADA
jgi:hypothetical protein